MSASLSLSLALSSHRSCSLTSSPSRPSSGGGPCFAATAEPKEQGGEQAGEHRPEEVPHGPDAGGPGTGAGGRLIGHGTWRKVPGRTDEHLGDGGWRGIPRTKINRKSPSGR